MLTGGSLSPSNVLLLLLLLPPGYVEVQRSLDAAAAVIALEIVPQVVEVGTGLAVLEIEAGSELGAKGKRKCVVSKELRTSRN